MAYQEEVFDNKSSEALAQVAQKGGGALSLEIPKVRLDQAISTSWSCGCPCLVQGS